MIITAREEGLVGVIEKTIENNINSYPTAVEQLVNVRNIMLQNKHPYTDQSSDDEEDSDSDDSVK